MNKSKYRTPFSQLWRKIAADENCPQFESLQAKIKSFERKTIRESASDRFKHTVII